MARAPKAQRRVAPRDRRLWAFDAGCHGTDKERALADKEREHTARLEAEAEVARLKALLERGAKR